MQIAASHAAEQREIAFVAIAVDGLSLRRYLRGDVEEEREIGLRKMTLNLEQPRWVKALRLAIRHTGREVPIANQNLTIAAPPFDLRAPFVAIGHVEQLHDVGRIVARASQRSLDLFA